MIYESSAVGSSQVSVSTGIVIIYYVIMLLSDYVWSLVCILEESGLSFFF